VDTVDLSFGNIAVVNEWNDAKKLLWLKKRLIGRAQLALQHLSIEMQADYALLKTALKNQYPDSRERRYQEESRYATRSLRKDGQTLPRISNY